MGETVPFASNYTDVSTYDGYQFEFYCRRCGNGHRSAFRPAITSFGGRLAELGGSLLGGEIGSRIQQVGMFAHYGRSSTRGVTNDQRLREAAEDVADEFHQCRGCTEWVCRQVCWNEPAGVCHQCAAARQSAAPVASTGSAARTAVPSEPAGSAATAARPWPDRCSAAAVAPILTAPGSAGSAVRRWAAERGRPGPMTFAGPHRRFRVRPE